MSLEERLIIELADVKNYLKVEHEEDDDLINDLIDTAKEQASAYLNNDFREEQNGEWVNLPVPRTVIIACLKMIGAWYEVRTDHLTNVSAGGVSISFGEMPWSAQKLLFPYRKQAWR